MRSQRAQLEGELRASVQNDDITESLARFGTSGLYFYVLPCRRGNKDQEKVFEEELKKHDKIVAFIKQNIAAQENIIRFDYNNPLITGSEIYPLLSNIHSLPTDRAMTERNAEYADARVKVDNVVRAREDMIGSLVASYHAYEDLLTKTTKGLEFYDKLEANVSKLLARVGGVVKVQEEERTAQLSSSAMKAADAHALSLRLVAGQGVPPPSGSPVSRFPPGAPPPDTPERTPPFIPPPSVNMPGVPSLPSGISTSTKSTKSRPKLSDYLNARKEASVPKQTEGLDSSGSEAPGVRPQPLGEESGPSTSSYSSFQNSSGSGFYTQASPSFTNPGQASQLLLQQQQLQAILGQHHQKQQFAQNQWPAAAGSGSPYATLHSPIVSQSGPIPTSNMTNQPQPQSPLHPVTFTQPSSHSPQPVAYPGRHQTPEGQQYRQEEQKVAQQHITPSTSQASRPTLPPTNYPPAQVIQHYTHTGQHLAHPSRPALQPGVQPTTAVRQPFPVGQPPLSTGQNRYHPGNPGQQITQANMYPGQPTQPGGHHVPQQQTPAMSKSSTKEQNSFNSNQQPSPQQQHVYHQHQTHPQQQVTHPQQFANQGPGNSQQPRPILPMYQGHPGQNPQGYHQVHPVAPGQPRQQLPPQAVAQQTTVQQHTMTGQNNNSSQIGPPPTAANQSHPQTQGPTGQPNNRSLSQPPQGQQLTQAPVQTGPMAHLQHQQQLWQHGQRLPHVPGGFPAVGHHAPPTGHPQLPAQHQVTQSAPVVGHQQATGQHGNQGQLHAGNPVPSPLYQQQAHQQITQPGLFYQTQHQHPKQQLPQQPELKASVPKDISAPVPGSNLALLSDISLSAPTPVKEPVSPPPPSRPVVPQPGTATSKFSSPSASLSSTLPSLSQEEHLARLAQHREILVKVVDGLGQQGCLEKQWKEVLDTAEIGEKRSVSVARCYPDMNRTPDVLPYDQTRVELKGWKDDYINASRIASFPSDNSVTGAVVTQAPQTRYLGQFWGLVWQEGVEVLVCLVPDHDLGVAGVYLPQEKEKKEVGNFIISTFSCKRHSTYVERVVNVTNKEGGSTRALVHLQMIGWQGPDMPTSPAPLVDTALAVLEQKTRSTILVHCLEGSSKSGTFLSLLWLVAEMVGKPLPIPSSSSAWPLVVPALAHVVHQRKGIVRDKQFIGLVYHALLHYCNHTLGKAGLLNSAAAILPNVPTGQVPVHASSGQIIASQPQPSPSPAPSSVSVPALELVEPQHNLEMTDPTQNLHDELAPLHLDQQGAESCPILGSVLDTQVASPKIPSDLSKLADISLTESPKKQRITKEDFLKPSTGLVTKEQNTKDPLDMLDPLWSLK